MISGIVKNLHLYGAGSIQKIWVSKDIFNSMTEYPAYVENEHTFTFKEIVLQGFRLRVFNIEEIGAMLQVRMKNEGIDEQIEICTKNCAEEYDECCKKWKEHWAQYDEALITIKSDFDSYIENSSFY